MIHSVKLNWFIAYTPIYGWTVRGKETVFTIHNDNPQWKCYPSHWFYISFSSVSREYSARWLQSHHIREYNEGVFLLFLSLSFENENDRKKSTKNNTPIHCWYVVSVQHVIFSVHFFPFFLIHMQRESITSAFGLKRPITMTEYIKMQINRGLATPTTLFVLFVCSQTTNYIFHHERRCLIPFYRSSMFLS